MTYSPHEIIELEKKKAGLEDRVADYIIGWLAAWDYWYDKFFERWFTLVGIFAHIILAAGVILWLYS